MKNSVTKRVFSVLLTAILLLGTLPVLSLPTFAASETDLTFELLEYGENQGGPNGYKITGCDLNASGELVIPSEYNGKPVSLIGSNAFRNCTELTSITVPDSVFEIMSYAFEGCTGLKTVVINDVPYIGSEAFLGCTSLESVTLPNGIEEISYGMFEGCTSLASVTIPDTVTSIGEYAFEGCTGLTSITIPNGVTDIGYYAFLNCSQNFAIKGYTYSAAHDYAIENSIKFISIGQSDPLRYKLNNAGTEYWVENCSTAYSGEIVIPSVHNGKPVTFIGKEAFCGCSNLTSVIISNGVTRICDKAFYNCDALEQVTIPNTVTAIETCAFASCEKLLQIELPDSVTFLAGCAFSGCGIEKIVIPKNVSTIRL